MKKIYGLLKQMSPSADDVANYFFDEAAGMSSFESSDSFENNLADKLVRQGISPMHAKKAAKLASQGQINRPATGSPTQPSAGAVAKGGANFNLKIVRNTILTGVDLPVILFGYYERQSQYIDFLNYDNTVITAFALTGTKDLMFAYTKGEAGTDTITVSCKEVPYVNLLQATGGGVIELSKFRLTVPSDTMVGQFDEAIETRKRSMFGKGSDDSITPSSFITETAFKSTVVTLPVAYLIDQERFMRMKMAQVNNNTLNISMFARQFSAK